MMDLALLDTVGRIDPDLIEESMELYSAEVTPLVPKAPGAFSRFMNSGWGVAVVCAIVSFGVMTGIIWAGRNPPDEPIIPIGGTDESRLDISATEPTVTEDGISSELMTEVPTEGVMYDPITQDGFTFISKGDGTCTVNAADGTLSGEVTIPEVSPYGDRVTAIAAYGFKDRTAITSLILPDSVTAIGSGAFRGCNGLESIRMPAKLDSMGTAVFQQCTKLLSVTLPAGLETLPRQTFETCTELRSVEFGDGLVKIEDSAFNGCSRLGTLNIPGTLESVGNSAFFNCCGLSHIYFGGTREEWQAVKIHKVGNDHFTGTPVTLTE